MSQKIIDILNEDREFELAAIMQYMGHHYEAEGIESTPLLSIFKKTSIDEMKHAEALAERIAYLGGIPAIRPKQIMKGGDLRKMVGDDLAAENGAIQRYKDHIKICDSEGDITTRMILEEILRQEEEHAATWQTVLGRGKK